MAVQSSQADVEKILADMRSALLQKKYVWIDRKKNKDTIADLGIMMSDVWDELFDLKYSDYRSGPEIDRDLPDSDKLWIFKKGINGQVIYIKFKVEYQKDGQVRLISFHIDELPE